MAYLRNRAINLVNLHTGIQAFAQNMGGIFILVFLLRAGVSIPMALSAMALIFAGRFAVRPALLAFGMRVGLKPLVILGNLGIAAQYPILAFVHGLGLPLLAYCAVAAIGDTFYWAPYHAYFASLGDDEHRGHQVSAREALSAIAGIAAPLAGAWLLVTAGPLVAFAGVGIVQVLALLPLFFTPNVPIAREAPDAYRAAFRSLAIFVADGWSASMSFFVWQIALFLTLKQSYQAYGGAMALAALVGAGSGMIIGRYIDAGHGRRSLVIAYCAAAAVVVLRAASLGVPWLALIANALGPVVLCLQSPVMMTAVYNLAKASPCTLRFHVVAEGGWDVGTALACLVAAGLAALNVGLSLVLALGAIGLAGSVAALRPYYALRKT